MAADKPILGYWAIRGLAQPIRLLLAHAGVDYEDRRYAVSGPTADGGWNLDDWLSKKHTLGLDFPNLPFWIEGDLRITQSTAILLHVAKKARLMGSTPEARAQALMLLGVSADLRDKFVALSYGAGFDAARGPFVSGPLAAAVASLEAFAAKHAAAGPYLLGAELTFADFVWADLLEQMVTLEAACLASAPTLQKHMAALFALPKVAAYRASPAFIDRPYNNLMAQFK